MIEDAIERNIVERIDALNIDGLAVRGMWALAASGEVKGEDAGDAAAAVVSVSPRSFDSFAHPAVTFDISVSVVIRTDLCPAGEMVKICSQRLMDMFGQWNVSLHAGADDDCGFSVPGFRPGGIQLTGGMGPAFNRSKCIWTVDFNLTLKGVVHS